MQSPFLSPMCAPWILYNTLGIQFCLIKSCHPLHSALLWNSKILMQVLQPVLSQRAVLSKNTPSPLWCLISSWLVFEFLQGDTFESKFLNTINSDYIFLDIRTSRSYLVSFSSIFCSLGGSSFSSFQKIDSSYLLAYFRLRVVGTSKLRIEIEQVTTRKSTGGNWGEDGLSFSRHGPLLPDHEHIISRAFH